MIDLYQEKRSFVRFPRIMPVKFSVVGNNGEAIAHTHDVSAKGVGLIIEKALPVEARIELWLYTTQDQEPVYTQGHIVWCKMVAPNVYRSGIDLDKVDFMEIGCILRLRG